MRWGENWRLYLTPGDGLLISLLEEFLSKSVSFINDISLCSARHLLSSQKGNYLFRPGNNISYCLSSRARREAKPRRREKQSQGLLFPDWRMPGSLTPLSRFLVLRQNGLCMWVCAFKGMYECVCVCVCETGVKGPGEIFSLPCLKYPTLTHSFYEHLARALRGPWTEEGHPSLWASTLESTLLWNFVFIWCFFDCSMGERD